jgi:hypothetical protein
MKKNNEAAKEPAQRWQLETPEILGESGVSPRLGNPEFVGMEQADLFHALIVRDPALLHSLVLPSKICVEPPKPDASVNPPGHRRG